MLGIESSCDDTGVAVMTPEGRILGQALATQADVHRYAEPLSCILWTAAHDCVCCFKCCTDVTSPNQSLLSCREWGGVVPTLAMEAHRAAIDSTVDTALARANVAAADLAAVAVTVGPGLVMCLQVRVLQGMACATTEQQYHAVRRERCPGRPSARNSLF